MANDLGRADRRHKSPLVDRADAADPRSEAQRDCDRILNYSKYFHRLAGKSQIISPVATRELMHDRKTHTEKVAQMAEAIARRLLHNVDYASRAREGSGLDPLVTRAAAGAHDLGHPPFGHVGEEELDRIGRAHGLKEGFQANAQSFRIVTKLDVHPGVAHGLDLTYAVQHALLKYPWTAGFIVGDVKGRQPDPAKYWGIYSSELPDYEGGVRAEVREGLEPWERTLEATVMDTADDMTFALHDFEDFFNLGRLNIPELLSDGFWADEGETMGRLQARYPADFVASEWTRAVNSVSRHLRQDAMAELRRASVDSREQEKAMRRFTSYWLTRWLAGCSIDRHGRFALETSTWHEINVLKQITWERVIIRPELRAAQEGDRRVVRELAAMLIEAFTSDPGRTPSRLQGLVDLNVGDGDWKIGKTDEAILVRSVLDYVSWLTEVQARELWSVMSGMETLNYGRTWIR